MMPHILQSIPVLVLYPHKRCNCRCLMCDIWKETDEAQISPSRFAEYMKDICRLQVKWIVFSGGEPLMHSDLFRLCDMARSQGIRVTILTTGLLMDRRADQIAASVDDLIVSLDGPEALHDHIRRVPGAFQRIAAGVKRLHELNPDLLISARCTIQQANHDRLCETANAAFDLGLHSISFLAADLSSGSFHRSDTWNERDGQRLSLTVDEIEILERSIERLMVEWEGTGFVREGKTKFTRIVQHFRSHLGLTDAVAPQCNAPWVSAVVESDGQLRPCFFHPPIGRLAGDDLLRVLNGFEAVAFRSRLDVATNPICRRCVCSFNWSESGLETGSTVFTNFSHSKDKPQALFPLSSVS